MSSESGQAETTGLRKDLISGDHLSGLFVTLIKQQFWQLSMLT